MAKFDPHQNIIDAINTLFPEPCVAEVRILKAGKLGTVSGYFKLPEHIDEMVAAVEEHDGAVQRVLDNQKIQYIPTCWLVHTTARGPTRFTQRKTGQSLSGTGFPSTLTRYDSPVSRPAMKRRRRRSS